MGFRDPWALDARDFPAAGSLRDQGRFALRHAILAPSGHNTQPWRFVLRDASIDIRADRTRALPVVDPRDRALTISCGAALGHLCTALRAFRVGHAAALLPDPADGDLLARVGLSGEIAAPDLVAERLLQAIPRRRSNRGIYEDKHPPPADLIACAEAAAVEGACLHIVTDPGEREKVGALVAEGDRIQFHDPAFREELARWVKSHHGSGQDGISGQAFGMPDLLSFAGAAAIRHVDMGPMIGAKDAKFARDAPALGLLTSAEDNVADWLLAGRALSRVLLTLTDRGMTSAFLNEPIEVAELRPRLRALFPAAGMPQILIRMGYAADIPPAARRHLEDVVTEA